MFNERLWLRLEQGLMSQLGISTKDSKNLCLYWNWNYKLQSWDKSLAVGVSMFSIDLRQIWVVYFI